MNVAMRRDPHQNSIGRARKPSYFQVLNGLLRARLCKSSELTQSIKANFLLPYGACFSFQKQNNFVPKVQRLDFRMAIMSWA
jgi:hypothetical protein